MCLVEQANVRNAHSLYLASERYCMCVGLCCVSQMFHQEVTDGSIYMYIYFIVGSTGQDSKEVNRHEGTVYMYMWVGDVVALGYTVHGILLLCTVYVMYMYMYVFL